MEQTMKPIDCNHSDRLLAAALAGEPLTATQQEALAAHRAACPGCAVAYAALQARPPRPALPPAYWDAFADRLADRLEAEAHAAQRSRTRAPAAPWTRLRSRWEHFLGGHAFAWSYRLAFAVLLVVVGVVIGRRTAEVAGDAPTVAVAPGGDAGVMRPAALEARTRQYMDRSRVLLLGLMHFDPAEDDPAWLNLPRKQAVARELVAQAAPLKQDLDDARQQRLRELVVDLEVILLQIANLEAEQDLPAVELVRQGVDHRALLLKITLEEMRMAPADAAPDAPADASPPREHS